MVKKMSEFKRYYKLLKVKAIKWKDIPQEIRIKMVQYGLVDVE